MPSKHVNCRYAGHFKTEQGFGTYCKLYGNTSGPATMREGYMPRAGNGGLDLENPLCRGAEARKMKSSCTKACLEYTVADSMM